MYYTTTVPNKGDWGRIQLGTSNGNISLKNTIFKYGGGYYKGIMEINNLSSVNTLENLEFANSGSYGLFSSLPMTIHNARFHDNNSGALWINSMWTNPTDATNNWWGDDSGPTVASNPNGKGEKIIGNILYDPWIGKVTKKDPVILIPGILGTEMKKIDELVWMNVVGLTKSGTDDFMDILMMDEYGLIKDNDVLFTDAIRHKNYIFGDFHYFDLLLNEFKDKGFDENINLFTFPYDWRLDNRINAQKLQEKIDSVLVQTGSQKVNIVAHSMGGLVAKQYIVDNGEDKVSKLVFIGTPNLGAPKAFKALLQGDTFGIPLILNQLEMKKLAKNMTSVYQLLPSQVYFDRFGGYFFNRNDLPDNYVTTKNYLIENNFNNLLLQNAEEFHTDALDNFFAPNIDTYNITGCNTKTIGRIILRNYFLEGGILKEEYDLKMVVGDGTVPLSSALAVSTKHHYYVTNADHGKMPSQDGIRQLVTQIITNSVNNEDLPNNIFADTSKCFVKKGKLISGHSPVDLHVYDSAGNHIGLTEDGVIEQNIPNAIYENLADNKFIFLPEDEDQTYTVKLDATATSTFSFRIATLNGDETEQMVYYNDIKIIPQSQGQILINAMSTDTILEFDYSGENNFIPLTADAILNAEQTQDFIKPVTQISITGQIGQNDWFTSVVQASLSANDENSGILKTEYSMDNGNTWETYIQPFEITTEGLTKILFKSIDKAGNKEEIREKIIKIDTKSPETMFWFEPTIKDIAFQGTDSMSSVVIVNNKDNIILSDEAGNTTELLFNIKENNNLLDVTLKTITYNGEVFTQPQNNFKFEYIFDKNDNIKHLNQNMSVEESFKLKSEYNANNGVTNIHGEDKGMCVSEEKTAGLKLFKLKTNNGVLNYNF